MRRWLVGAIGMFAGLLVFALPAYAGPVVGSFTWQVRVGVDCDPIAADDDACTPIDQSFVLENGIIDDFTATALVVDGNVVGTWQDAIPGFSDTITLDTATLPLTAQALVTFTLGGTPDLAAGTLSYADLQLMAFPEGGQPTFRVLSATSLVAVPEPATIALLLPASMYLVRRRRRFQGEPGSHTSRQS